MRGRYQVGALIAALALVAGTAAAADPPGWTNNAIAVTDASQTITITPKAREVHLINSGANDVYVCLWYEQQTAEACTAVAGSGRRLLKAGAAKGWTSPAQTSRWSAVSVICAAGLTSTVIGDSLP